MSATSVTVTGTAQFPSGAPIPGAVVNFNYDEDLTNSAAALTGSQTFAASNGTWSISVDATDDSATSPAGGLCEISVRDPVTGESVSRFRAPIPHTVTSQTLAGLLALAQ